MCWPPTCSRRLALLAVAVFAGVEFSPIIEATASAAPADSLDAGPGLDGADTGASPAPDVAAWGEAGPGPETATEAKSVPEEDRPAFLHATVNQVDGDDVFVLLRGEDVLVKVSDLQKPGMRAEGGRREKYGEDEMVSLASLAPQVKFLVDERALTLTVTADPSLFGSSVIDLMAKHPEGIVYGSAPSAFANYVLTEGLQRGGGARTSGYAEAGLSLRGHLLFASGQLRVDNSRDPANGQLRMDGSCDRLLTNVTLDFRQRLTSIVLGDFTAVSDVLSGGLTMGGASITRNYSLDPYYVFLPSQRLSGTALTPSTVEVYVNGQLVRRESLPPGQFSLQNIPTTSGSGETRVVVRDAFGSSQTVASPYYLALGTLAKGLHDFSYNLGFERKNYGVESWHYGPLGMLVRHRYGLTDWLSVGARIEGSLHRVSGGPSLALRLPFGELGAIVAASRQESGSGRAALVTYSFTGKPLYLQVGARYQSRGYTNMNNLPPEMDRQRFDALASIGKNISQVVSASIQYQATDWWYTGWTQRLTVMGNRTLTRWMYAYATFGTLLRAGSRTEYDLFAGLSFAPADRVSASVTHSDQWGAARGHLGATQASIQQSLPVGPGFGYRVVATQGENAMNQASVQYQGAYGRVEADYQQPGWNSSSGQQATLKLTGGAVLIGGRAFLTRQNQDGYALIRVPGVPGVHATISNQAVGTTDSKGDLLVPNLLHYYGNRIGINDKDIPIDHDIGTVEETIAPPYRGGMIVTFPVRRVQSVSGTVLIKDRDATIVPAYGQIVVTLGTRQILSPLDEAGNFYLEDLVPGAYMAEVQYAAGVCRLPLVVAAGATALVNVGTLACARTPDESPKQ